MLAVLECAKGPLLSTGANVLSIGKAVIVVFTPSLEVTPLQRRPCERRILSEDSSKLGDSESLLAELPCVKTFGQVYPSAWEQLLEGRIMTILSSYC